ncbi:MAG: hypothetical protein P4L73_03540 [Caulobacteraceae bacterium]|nr:hypothetical protein [Caulobacteraceae bacterium]
MTIIVCQAIGCTAPRKSSQFMCLPHWKALPLILRQQINRTWGAWRAAEGDARRLRWVDYIEARDEARRWTADGEGRLGQFEPDAPRIRRSYEREARS